MFAIPCRTGGASIVWMNGRSYACRLLFFIVIGAGSDRATSIPPAFYGAFGVVAPAGHC